MPLFATTPPAGAALLALAMVLTGCDQPAPTSTLDPVPPSAASAKAERTTGAFVFRGDVPGGLLMIDFDRERTLLVGNTAAQLADICAGGAFPSEVTEHDVVGPDGRLHVLVQAKSLPAAVWSVLTIDPCADLQGVTPLAEGTAQGRYTDNDFFGNGSGAGSFGVAIQGRMTLTATGEPVQLHAKFRNVFLPDGTIKLPVNEIILR
jgi:hypothetical protein